MQDIFDHIGVDWPRDGKIYKLLSYMRDEDAKLLLWYFKYLDEEDDKRRHAYNRAFD